MRNQLAHFSLFLLVSFIFGACGNESSQATEPSMPNKFGDQVILKMNEFADRRQADSLLPYLDDTSAFIRAEAAMLFGSIQAPQAGNRLQEMVEEENQQVSSAAAWAIGQLGDSTYTEHLMEMLLNRPLPYSSVYGTALGKAAGKLRILELLDLQAAGGIPEDKSLPLMHCIYRAGLRNIDMSNAADDFALFALEKPDAELQLYAAAYLGRARKPAKLANQEILFRNWQSVKDPEVRIHLVRAFRRTEGPMATDMLDIIAHRDEEDPMVRANAFLAAGKVHDLSTAALKASQSPNHQLATAASEYLLNNGKADFESLHRTALQCSNWRSRANLLRAALAKSNEKEAALILLEIDSLLPLAEHAYEKGYLLAALSSKAAHYDRLLDHCLIKQKVSSTLVAEAMMQNLESICGKDRKKMEGTLRAFVGTGDAAMLALVGEFIPEAQKSKQVQFKEADFLLDAQAKLKLPEEIETYNALEQAIAQIEGREAQPKHLEHQHPINWQLLKTIPSDQKAIVETSKGDITFLLLVEQAPGTVANFIELVQEGFYNEKTFHRIVPAFVAQGGCPRGDGYGSSPGVIRSEWPDLHYGPGMVGMASAGKDTESCQWFITHCHTPHLDGRYTIFAKVIQGMEVVQELEIGDEISSIRLPGLPLL